MSPKATRMLIIIAAILVFAGLILWWYLLFGRPNPPLTRTTMTVQGAASSSDAMAAAGVANAAATGTAASAPGADQLAIDGATFSVEIASTSIEQARGLSYRPSLGANDGMLFTFSRGGVQTFWMKDMNFPLDMIWISGNVVVGFAQDVPAPAPGTQLWQLPIYASPDATDKVLEVNAGMVAKYNIKVGDTVTFGSDILK